jgi:hypothetical protein
MPKAKAAKQPADVELEGWGVTAFCVRCKKKNAPMTDVVLTHVQDKQGKWRPMVKGKHKCGQTMVKFVNAAFVEEVNEAA